MKYYTLSREGNFYKGNLHTHTVVSDGELTPEDTVERYRKNGYHFLALSDHCHYGYYPELETENFLNIPSMEVQTSNGATWVHHLLVFGDPAVTKIKNHTLFPDRDHAELTIQQLIDKMKATGNLVMYNHPYWSKCDINEIIGLKNLVGMEIYNYGCDVPWKWGSSEVFYEHYLWHGNYLWAISTDDAHGRSQDYCGGYIVVKTDDFSHRGIISAIEKGSFFSCAAQEGEEAPKILDFYVEDGIAKIWCEPCRDIFLFAGRGEYPRVGNDSSHVHAKRQEPATYLELKLSGDAQYVRATLRDFNGNITWGQPIRLK